MTAFLHTVIFILLTQLISFVYERLSLSNRKKKRMFENQKPFCKPGKSSGKTCFLKWSIFQDKSFFFFFFPLSLILALFHVQDLASRDTAFIQETETNIPTFLEHKFDCKPINDLWFHKFIFFSYTTSLFSSQGNIHSPISILFYFPLYRGILENSTKLSCWELLASFDYRSQVLVFVLNNNAS